MSILDHFGLGGESLVTVDLGEESVKIGLAAVGVGGGISVSRLAALNISGLTDEAISHVIASCLVEMGVKTQDAICVLPTPFVITRNIEVPSIDQDEVRNIVVLQASRHTPYAREDILVDYVNMGVYMDTYTRVLLVVASRDKVRRQLEIMGNAGLKVEQVLFEPEIISLTTEMMIRSESVDSLRGIIHVTDTYTDFIVAQGPHLLFVRSVPMGVRDLAGGDAEQHARFTDEMKKTLDVYHEEEIDRNPNVFILTGAIERVRELKSLLDETLRANAQLVAYPQYLPVSEAASETLRTGGDVSFLHVIGALHVHEAVMVDLIPADVKSRLEFEERSKDIVRTGVLAIIILLLIPAILYVKMTFKKHNLERLRTRYKPILEEAAQLQRDFAKVKVIKDFMSRERPSLAVLEELYKRLPDNVRCTEIRYDKKGTFSIKGEALTIPLVNALTRDLDQCERFQKVHLPNPTKSPEGDYVEFDIKCDLVGKKEEEE